MTPRMVPTLVNPAIREISKDDPRMIRGEAIILPGDCGEIVAATANKPRTPITNYERAVTIRDLQFGLG